MAKIRHIALTTRNVRATAEFFKQAFGMVEIPQRPNSPVEAATLSDGYINVTVLGWKRTATAVAVLVCTTSGFM